MGQRAGMKNSIINIYKSKGWDRPMAETVALLSTVIPFVELGIGS